jgi:hypothetical protein
LLRQAVLVRAHGLIRQRRPLENDPFVGFKQAFFKQASLKQVSRRNRPPPVPANQLPVERLVVAYIGQSACQAPGTRESAGLPDFTGKCDSGTNAGRAARMALLLHCESLRIMV